MWSLSPAVRIFLCRVPTDMRRSFDSLAALVETVVGQDPLSGHLFLFRSRRRDRVKLLYWDGDGLAIWYKRLEEGTFEFPGDGAGELAAQEAEALEVRASELALLLGGIELASVRRRPRYQRGHAARP